MAFEQRSSWAVDITELVNNTDANSGQAPGSSIYRVTTDIRYQNSKSYKPQMISFGPYHHGNKRLQKMEKHKERALVHFLKRANNNHTSSSISNTNDKASLGEFWRAIEEIIDQLRDSYHNLELKWRQNKDEFVKLMLLDGCCMLEILRTATMWPNDYPQHDPFFSTHALRSNLPTIKSDMLKMENQLPLLVLKKLITVENGTTISSDEYINNLVLTFCTPVAHDPFPRSMPLGLHLLDIYRKSLLQGSDEDPGSDPSSHTINSTVNVQPKPEWHTITVSPIPIIHTATEVKALAGVRFKKSKTNSLLDIKFKSGVLSLPHIYVDDSTENTFLNLMAFEGLHFGINDEVTSYVHFMDNIIDTEKDVDILHSKGIISCISGKAVAKLFNNLWKTNSARLNPESHLGEVNRQINAYCHSRWNIWKANLKHRYCDSPWSIISLVVAIYTFAFGVYSSVVTVIATYKAGSG